VRRCQRSLFARPPHVMAGDHAVRRMEAPDFLGATSPRLGVIKCLRFSPGSSTKNTVSKKMEAQAPSPAAPLGMVESRKGRGSGKPSVRFPLQFRARPHPQVFRRDPTRATGKAYMCCLAGGAQHQQNCRLARATETASAGSSEAIILIGLAGPLLALSAICTVPGFYPAATPEKLGLENERRRLRTNLNAIQAGIAL